MSLNLAKTFVASRLTQRNMMQSNPNLDANTAALIKVANSAPTPFTFIQSNVNALSSNVSDGVLIIQSPVMNHGERGVVEDLNINFTTVAGTVRIVILDANNTIIQDVLRSITANTNGVGQPVLEEGQSLAVAGQSAGAGVFSVYCSGKLQGVT